jgi:diguanylate cyclase (GGDEF)-like protein
MNVVRGALESLAAILETNYSLVETIALCERDFGRSLGAESVAIRLGECEDVAGDASSLVVPLVLDGARTGTMIVRFRPGFDSGAEIARLLGAPLAAAFAWRAHNDERARLHELIRTDALTGLANRMAFDEYLDGAWRRCSERRAPLTVVLLDIDYFKVYNDVYGHVAGDECLRAVATFLRAQSRSGSDLVARYGGEEFALISETLTPDTAMAVIGRILRIFDDRPIAHEGSTLGRISVSAGIASFVPGNSSIADFIREADRSLYRAKVLGRNRVCAGTQVSNGPIVSRHARAGSAPPPFEDATVGREDDIARVTAALRQSRMLTLVGPPGIGKSRLARLVGSAAQHTLTDGVIYLDLAMLARDSDPVATLAAALDIAVASGDVLDAVRDAVQDTLRERNALVIFDHADAIDPARVSARCDELLATAPSISIIATSRTALGAAEERAVVVAPLSEDAAIELLRLRSGLGPGADMRRLREIARTSGGIPAALEAAAMLHRLMPEEELVRPEPA